MNVKQMKRVTIGNTKVIDKRECEAEQNSSIELIKLSTYDVQNKEIEKYDTILRKSEQKNKGVLSQRYEFAGKIRY